MSQSVRAPQPSVTALLAAWRAGDEGAHAVLFARLYDELYDLAHRQRYRWRGNLTVGTTALVHELYLRLAARSEIAAHDRAHFLQLAGQVVRHILVDYARRQKRQKRGGGRSPVPVEALDALLPQLETEIEEILSLDQALAVLGGYSERMARIVELRFFAGCSLDEIADVLAVTTRTVSRDWEKARGLLYRELAGDPVARQLDG